MSEQINLEQSAKMARALARLYTARKARNEARKAFSKYLSDAWNERGHDEYGHPTRSDQSHKFGCCQLGHTANRDDEPVPILCPVCMGSGPFHAAYIKASREAGQALRIAQAIGRRIAEGKP